MNNDNDNPVEENFAKTNRKLTDELLALTYNELISKYPDKKTYFDKVFYYGVDGDILLLRNLLADDFTPEGMELKLNKEQNDQIIKFLAEDQSKNPETIINLIKQVFLQAVLPKDFDYEDYHDRSGRINNALLSIKNFISEYEASRYKDDVSFFLKLSPVQLDQYLKTVDDIITKLGKEYEKVLKGNPIDVAALNEAADFIGRCGRVKIYTDSLKEKKVLGEISEVINKLEKAMKITLEIMQNKMPIATEEDLLSTIANHLVENIHL